MLNYKILWNIVLNFCYLLVTDTKQMGIRIIELDLDLAKQKLTNLNTYVLEFMTKNIKIH